jgi:hypothetical protein
MIDKLMNVLSAWCLLCGFIGFMFLVKIAIAAGYGCVAGHAFGQDFSFGANCVQVDK